MSSLSYRAHREQKADKIIVVLQDFLGDLSGLRCLDIGCGRGIIALRLADVFGFVVGVDLELSELREAWLGKQRVNLRFVHADGSHLPFPSGCFDVVVCAQVYEHVQDQKALASEIWRTLRTGGVCFFSGPNRWAMVEEHYWLPFLSWLPGPLADRYVHFFRGQPRYDIWPLSYWRLRSMWRDFWIYDYTVPMLKSPERFRLSMKALRILRYVPAGILKFLLPVVPNYNWVLVKCERAKGLVRSLGIL